MPGLCRNVKARHSLWVGLAFLCCALIALSGIVQAGHTHTDGRTVQSDCALCHVAHHAIQPAVPQALPRIFLIAAAIVAAQQLVCLYSSSAFPLFTRPPPARAAQR
jgi:hypothetical protein